MLFWWQGSFFYFLLRSKFGGYFHLCNDVWQKYSSYHFYYTMFYNKKKACACLYGAIIYLHEYAVKHIWFCSWPKTHNSCLFLSTVSNLQKTFNIYNAFLFYYHPFVSKHVEQMFPCLSACGRRNIINNIVCKIIELRLWYYIVLF